MWLKKEENTHTAYSHNINKTRSPAELAGGETAVAPPALLPQTPSPGREVAARWSRAPRPRARRSARQPAPSGWHSRRCRGAAFNPEQEAERPACAQPPPALRPAGGQARGGAGPRGPVAAPGTRQRRPCTRGRRSATLLERTGAEVRAQGRGQAEHAPSTPRPLSRVLLTPGRMATGPATPVTPAPATARVPEPTPPAAPPPGPGRTAGLGARRQ